jgi:hypothetical protein
MSPFTLIRLDLLRFLEKVACPAARQHVQFYCCRFSGFVMVKRAANLLVVGHRHDAVMAAAVIAIAAAAAWADT